jgi:hypothetical protein
MEDQRVGQLLKLKPWLNGIIPHGVTGGGVTDGLTASWTGRENHYQDR